MGIYRRSCDSEPVLKIIKVQFWQGCYFPCEKVKKLLCDDLTVVFIVLSKQYIIENFDKIIKYENIVEDRRFPESREIKFFINENERIKEECIKYGLRVF